jgi:hypothetical protein
MAAGNMAYDGFHSYTYDAEGNITAVDSGSTATYVYNALNQRVRATVGGTITEYVFNAAGQRVSEWNGATRAKEHQATSTVTPGNLGPTWVQVVPDTMHLGPTRRTTNLNESTS